MMWSKQNSFIGHLISFPHNLRIQHKADLNPFNHPGNHNTPWQLPEPPSVTTATDPPSIAFAASSTGKSSTRFWKTTESMLRGRWVRCGWMFHRQILSNLLFFGRRPKWFWNDQKKLSQYGRNVWKYRLMDTVMASFNITVRQMSEMFQRKTEQFPTPSKLQLA